MNTRAQNRESASQAEFLKHANFEPVFDEEGKIADIRELKIPTDRRSGMAAMRELFETHQDGDALVGADGWSGKQRRILSSAAPLAAHYLRHSQKWDARTGMMRDAALILLPVEVIWALFEMLFEGQYSFKVIETFQEDEEVVPVGNDHRGEQADDAPGRRFYARATVRLSIHLPGQKQSRDIEGVGVSYGQVRTEKTGNIFAINSERRTVDKGAIADAKREALSNVGRVFRRAFEDGDEMVEHIEGLLLDKVQEMNRPAIHRKGRSSEAVPAPKSRRTKPVSTADKDEDTPDKVASEDPNVDKNADEEQVSSTVSLVLPDSTERLISLENIQETIIDLIFEVCATKEQALALIKLNQAVIDEHIEDISEVDEIVSSIDDQPYDEIPDFDLPDDKDGDELIEISVEGKSGKAILAELKSSLDAAKTVSEINAIIKVNPKAIRKLTPKQMKQFADHRSKRDIEIS